MHKTDDHRIKLRQASELLIPLTQLNQLNQIEQSNMLKWEYRTNVQDNACASYESALWFEQRIARITVNMQYIIFHKIQSPHLWIIYKKNEGDSHSLPRSDLPPGANTGDRKNHKMNLTLIYIRTRPSPACHRFLSSKSLSIFFSNNFQKFFPLSFSVPPQEHSSDSLH